MAGWKEEETNEWWNTMTAAPRRVNKSSLDMLYLLYRYCYCYCYVRGLRCVALHCTALRCFIHASRFTLSLSLVFFFCPLLARDEEGDD